MLELDFGDTSDKLKEEYLDVYKGMHSEILCTSRLDENSDLSTTKKTTKSRWMNHFLYQNKDTPWESC